MIGVDKCQVLLVGAKTKRFDYEMCAMKLRRAWCVKDLGVKIVSALSRFSQQSTDAANIASRMLGFNNRNFLCKLQQ